MDFRLHLLEAITDNFSEQRKVGSGGYGTVYKAVYNGQAIAVKKLHHLQGLDDKDFQNEYLNLVKLNEHPNIIRLIGYCHDTHGMFVKHNGELIFARQLERLLCFEYTERGDLNNYITDESSDLDWPTCYQVIKGICEGLNHLHNDQENPIFHLNLKPSKVLLDKNMTAKIAGFGLSRLDASDRTHKTEGLLRGKYVESGFISNKFDVFSLGTIIIKMMAGSSGYSRCLEMHPEDFIEHVSETWTKKLQGTLTSSSWEIETSRVKTCVEIALRCVESDRNKRPCIIDIVNELGGPEAATNIKIPISVQDEHKRDKPIDLDDLVHDVSAEPINIPLARLQDITLNFAHGRKIGQGGFGIVYEGVLQTGRIAVKRLLNSHTIEDEPFIREANFLMSVKHKNIVRFLGYCANTEYKAINTEGSGEVGNYMYTEIRERLLCFEYMNNGSLDKQLTDELHGLDWHTRYKIIRGICEGLQYLHNEKHILHMDLKPANILLDDFMVPKITDFGISRHLDGITHAETQRCLASLGYCAPEYLRRGHVSFKLDIFSMGVIITDIVTGRKEEPDRKNVLRRWRNRWNRAAKYPPFGYQQISKCIEIAQSCMLENIKQRPSICEIISALDEMEGTNEPVSDADEYTVGQISPYPWELLEVDPLHLHFPFKQNKKIHCSLKLSNERDDYVAFDIQKPNMLQYCTEPDKGIVPPHTKSSVSITFQAHDRVPDGMLCRDKFTVRCAIVDDRFTTYNINEDVFNGSLGKVVDEVTLTFSFSN